MTNPKPIENKDVREKLTDLVDEYFPKIKPNGINKGRGEAMVIVAMALIELDKALTSQKSELKSKFEILIGEYYMEEPKGKFRIIIKDIPKFRSKVEEL